MIGYNPSHLNKNETLLEAFHRVEAYLKANPQYQVYQSSAQYQEGTQEYTLNTIIVPEGSKVGAGDVVLFSNVYYAVITSVSETTFSIDTATNFRGTDGTNGKDGTNGVTPNISVSATVDNSEGTPSVEVTKSGTNENPSFAFDFHNIKGEIGTPGPQGPKGETGATPNITMTADVVGGTGEPSVDVFKGNTIEQPHYTFVFHNLKGEPGTPGPTGENGKNGTNGKNGNATYLCSAQLTQNTAAISKSTITTFPGRPIIENDIIISTAITTFGAMSQVIGQDENTVTVNFIGTLKSESGGGTTLNKYTVSKPSISLFAKIYLNAKGNISGAFGVNIDNTIDHGFSVGAMRPSGNNTIRATICSGVGLTKIYVGEILIRDMNSSPYVDVRFSNVYEISADSVTKVDVGTYNADYSSIVYYNDTEITV